MKTHACQCLQADTHIWLETYMHACPIVTAKILGQISTGPMDQFFL